MSNTALSPPSDDLEEWNHILTQLEQHLSIREQIATAVRDANAAFAAQLTQPDAYNYWFACDQFEKFLNLKIPLEESDQRSVVQVLQVACAMHENVVNNPALSSSERSVHYLSSASLVTLCESALQGSITHTDLWCEVLNLSHRADRALSNAVDALDLCKYFDFINMTEDCFSESGNGAGQMSATPSSPSSASKPAMQRASVHDISDGRQTPRSATLREKALKLLNVNDRPPKAPPLGRAHTMPSLAQATSSRPSRTGRTSLKALSRGNGLHVLQEIEE